MTEEAIPKNMVEFALHMARECQRRSQNFYGEADQASDSELTRKVKQYLGPLKKEIDEWKQREDKAKSTGAYG